MIGKVIAGIISVTLITFLILLITFYFLQENIKVEINRLNYEIVEVITTQGYFSGDLYGELREQVNKYSDFYIQLKLEQWVKEGVYDTYYHPDEILNKPLQIGDKISIYIEDQHATIFSRLLTSALGFGSSGDYEQRIKSLKTGMVVKEYKDIRKGYDVMVDIQKYASNHGVALFVVTKLNEDGKYYGSSGHPDVPYTNLNYGDSTDELHTTGVNYIFDNGVFNRIISYYPNGEIRLINYIQQ
ncbi:hypothetical protein [Alkaliphilus hydrothermalis]|uniref:Uncharacterized protein n=1 Tax=Alkaliphilus hydrothermalis TaxID=1482730 RepID=A0ABS2NL23_9FIRM|nr:hypothetical protein [Alkaliphilus hydrothermalis]MBM7613602.1 hypothetical protein [Alkaliphilus hydrothermalis]